MLRMLLSVVAGFFVWAFAWGGVEVILSAIWPDWFGAHQRAFTAAIKSGGQFTADTGILCIQIVLGAAAALLAGFVAAWIAREPKRAPLIVGLLLTAVGVLKAAMSWPFVPVWFHIVFTVLLLPMAVWGGRLKAAGPVSRG